MDVLTNFSVIIISLYIYIYQVITLHSLNLYGVVCQLYFNKTGGRGGMCTTALIMHLCF